jgi:hypothetical protein
LPNCGTPIALQYQAELATAGLVRKCKKYRRAIGKW